MLCIVDGASGFIGRHVVDVLLEEKNEVVVLVRDKKRFQQYYNIHVKIIECALEKYDKVDYTILEGRKADIFFHFAWEGIQGNKADSIDVQTNNIKNTCNAIELAYKLGCKRFVNAGTIIEYESIKIVGDVSVEKLREQNIYGGAKLSAEIMGKILAHKYEIDYINMVISNVYGEGEKSECFTNVVLEKMLKNETLELTSCTQFYDFIYIVDAAKAIVLAACKGEKGKAYYVGNKTQRPLKEYVLKMKELTKSTSKLLFGAAPFVGTQIPFQELNVDRLHKELGFQPKVSFEDGIRNMILYKMENYKME